jgi:hypothetical protein
MFQAPIPGESLTRPPKQFPWERPPEMNDPEEVMQFYIDKLTDADRMSAIMDTLEVGMTIRDVTEGIVRVGVSEGMHSIDVGILVSPVIHQYIKSVAKALKIDFDEGFVDKKQQAEDQKKVMYLKAKLAAQQQKELVQEIQQEAPVMEEETVVKPKGLMTRRGK